MQGQIDGAIARAESVDALLRHLESTLPKVEEATQIKNAVGVLTYAVTALTAKFDEFVDEVRNVLAVLTYKVEQPAPTRDSDNPLSQLVRAQ